MFSARLTYRHLRPRKNTVCISTSCLRKESADDTKQSDKNNEETKQEPPKKNQAAIDKLQNLLQKMVQDQETPTKVDEKLKLSKPVKYVYEKRPSYKVKMDKVKDHQTIELLTKVKEVADEIGGDVIQTESELLNILLKNDGPKMTEVDEKVPTLNDLIVGMKIDRSGTKPEQDRASQVRRILSSRKEMGVQQTEKRVKDRQYDTGIVSKLLDKRVKIFGQKPLGIFTTDQSLRHVNLLKTWSELEKKELKLLVTHPPENIFQEMIMWTEQGKLWHFPIDNEQGMEKEKQTDFTEHIFLEEYLEPWCPPKGPIRHFMELVCVGLSKNHYLSVDVKKEHIYWFRDYFEQKKKLLTEVGAITKEDVKRLQSS